MKIKIKDFIYHSKNYKIHIDYTDFIISPKKYYSVYLEDNEIVKLFGLKASDKIPTSASSGIILETNQDLRALMKYNPRKINLWLELFNPIDLDTDDKKEFVKKSNTTWIKRKIW